MAETINAHVVIDEGATEDEIAGLQQYLEDRNVAATVEADYPSDARETVSVGLTRHERGTADTYKRSDPDWTILVHSRINRLVRQLGPETIRETLDGLRNLRARQTGTSPANGALFLVDEETGVRFDVEFQLPLNAYTDLENLRINSFAADPVSFHRQSGPQGRWRAPR